MSTENDNSWGGFYALAIAAAFTTAIAVSFGLQAEWANKNKEPALIARRKSQTQQRSQLQLKSASEKVHALGAPSDPAPQPNDKAGLVPDPEEILPGQPAKNPPVLQPAHNL